MGEVRQVVVHPDTMTDPDIRWIQRQEIAICLGFIRGTAKAVGYAYHEA
jgi:hypothetical protein